MSALTQWMDRTWYPGYEDRWDIKAFRALIERYLEPGFTVLDYGAGRGAVDEMNFHGRVERICGTDPDDAVLGNPNVDDARVLPLPSGTIPYDDATFDLVFANNVLEHITDPTVVFSQVARVLKPGGLFLAKTPNKWHYVPTIARVTPHSFHEFINKVRGREECDTFPTVYKCNTRGDVRRYAAESGFKVEHLELWEGRPEYLRWMAPLYVGGYLYERVANGASFLAPFRCGISFAARKD